MRSLITLLFSVIAASVAITPTFPAQAAGASWHVMGSAQTLPSFYQPAGLAIGPHGTIFVMDSGNFRVVALSPRGKILGQFGSRGTGQGQFGAVPIPEYPYGRVAGPASIAADQHGNLYVADTGNGRIEKFTTRGTFVEAWSVQEPDAAIHDMAVSVGPNGNVLIAIAAATRCSQLCAAYYIVQRRTSGGVLIGRWQSVDPPTGPQDSPDDIMNIALVVDHQGNIWVSTSGIVLCYKSCPSFAYLEKRSASGTLLAHWGSEGMQPGAQVIALAIGGRGNLFVAQAGQYPIEKRTPTNRVIAHWLTVRTPNGIAVDSRGDVYVSAVSANDIVHLSSTGRVLARWGDAGHAPGQLWRPGGVAADGSGGVWVMDTGNFRVQHFARDGHLLANWRVQSPGPAIAVDQQGNLYLSQILNHAVSIGKFSPAGRLLARFGAGMFLAGQAEGIAIASNGDLVILVELYHPNPADYQQDGNHILVLLPSGKQVSSWRSPTVTALGTLTVDGQGNIYVSDTMAGRISKLSPDGALLATWGGKGSPIQLSGSAGLAVDAQGNVYVSETNSDHIAVLSTAGVKISELGETGSDPGKLHRPTYLTLDSQGNLFVTDDGNMRVQRVVV